MLRRPANITTTRNRLELVNTFKTVTLSNPTLRLYLNASALDIASENSSFTAVNFSAVLPGQDIRWYTSKLHINLNNHTLNNLLYTDTGNNWLRRSKPRPPQPYTI